MINLTDIQTNKRVWIIRIGSDYLGYQGRRSNVPTWVKTEIEAHPYTTLTETLETLDALALDAGLQHLKISVYSRGLIPDVQTSITDATVEPVTEPASSSSSNVVSLFNR